VRNFIDGHDILEKVPEYLNSGVLAVVVLDPELRIAHVFSIYDSPSSLGFEEPDGITLCSTFNFR
jgi:hypothetical protein